MAPLGGRQLAHRLDGRFPFAASKSDASLPMLAEFVRKDSGRIERFSRRS
nr:hypothetical protein [Klebsiella pneumoniae subsp. pneumoniae]